MAAVAHGATARAKPKTKVNTHGSVRWLILLGLVFAAIMEVLDTSIINPVLPDMAGNLGATTQEIGWVSTAYILSNVIFLPLTNWLANTFGLKRYLVASIVLFIVASGLCAVSTSLNEMIVWRLLQGAAGAPLISMTQTAITEVFPNKREQGMAQGIWAIGITVAPSIAPTLGGWLADNYSWPYIFLINIPIGLATIGLIGVFFKDQARPRPGRIDVLGIGLLAVGLGSLQYVLEEGNSDDWFDSRLILFLTILGSICTLAFVLWQISRRNRAPVIDLKVMKDRTLSSSVIVCLVAGLGLYSGLYIFPLFAQRVLGYTALRSGLFLLPPGIVLGLGMVVTSVTMQRGVPARNLAFIGTLICVYSMWLLGHSSPQSNESDVQLALSIRGIGLAMIMLPITVAGIANLKGQAVGVGSSLINLARQLGGSIGIAVSSTYLTQMTDFHRANLIANASVGNRAFDQRIAQSVATLQSRGGLDAHAARQEALRLLDNTIGVQAYSMAVNNAFILTGILFALALPFVLLMRKGKGGAASVAMH